MGSVVECRHPSFTGLFDDWEGVFAVPFSISLFLMFHLLFYQVHITQGDTQGRAVIVSWVTMEEPGSNTVIYGTEESQFRFKAEGRITKYKFYNYTSGYIHHCTIKKLEVDFFFDH